MIKASGSMTFCVNKLNRVTFSDMTFCVQKLYMIKANSSVTLCVNKANRVIQSFLCTELREKT